MKKKIGNSKGFSLVELLIVIALIGIMSAIGVPAVLSQMDHLRFTRDVRGLSVELSAARMNAISKNVRYSVSVTQGVPDIYRTQTCSTVPAPAPSVACGAWANDTRRGLKTLSNNTDIIAPAADFRVEFLPTGTATATTITMSNTSAASEQMQIIVDAATGRVRIN